MNLFGYRVWGTDAEGYLYSVRAPVRWPWLAWPQDRALSASCARGFLPWGDHRAPVFNCTCGVYAWREPHKLGPKMSPGAPDPYGAHVLGVVQLWGRIIEHPLGYRAQHGRVVALQWSDLAEAVAQRYKAMLLGSLSDWSGLSES